MVIAGKFYILGPWNMLAKVATMFDVARPVPSAMQHERGDRNRSEHVPDVDLVVHLRKGANRTRSGAVSL